MAEEKKLEFKHPAVVAAEAKLRSERRQHRQELDRLNGTIEQLLSNLGTLSANFHEVNRRLVAMLPTTDRCDRWFADAYEDLCWSIESWVTLNCADLDRITGKIKNARWSNRQTQEIRELLDNGASLDKVAYYQDSGDWLLMKIIMRFLYEKLLRKARWLPAMSLEEEKMLNNVMEMMQDAYPERGIGYKEIWRTDTYKGLVMNTKLRESSNKQLDEIAEALAAIMCVFVDDMSTFDRPGLTKIVLAAAALGDTMRLGPVSYSFLYPFAPQMSFEARKITKAALSKTGIIDKKTGVSIKEADCTTNNDSPGEILCTIFPSLMRLAEDGTVIKLSLGKTLANMYDFSGVWYEFDTLSVILDSEKSQSHTDLDEKEAKQLQPALANPAVPQPAVPQPAAPQPAVPKSAPAKMSWADVVKKDNGKRS